MQKSSQMPHSQQVRARGRKAAVVSVAGEAAESGWEDQAQALTAGCSQGA